MFGAARRTGKLHQAEPVVSEEELYGS
jgi:hypothetical protein